MLLTGRWWKLAYNQIHDDSRTKAQTGIGPDRDLGDPQTHPTNWLLIGYAMAVMENGKPLPPIPMIKGFSLAIGQ